MTLEVHVNEAVQVFDLTPTGQQAFLQAIADLAWAFLDDNRPELTITLKKQGNKSPPTLGVAVGDGVATKEVLS